MWNVIEAIAKSADQKHSKDCATKYSFLPHSSSARITLDPRFSKAANDDLHGGENIDEIVARLEPEAAMDTISGAAHRSAGTANS